MSAMNEMALGPEHADAATSFDMVAELLKSQVHTASVWSISRNRVKGRVRGRAGHYSGVKNTGKELASLKLLISLVTQQIR